MTAPVSDIPNLGPKSEEVFAKAGIHSADALRDLGADAAYKKLILTGTRPHFIGYYALVMGLQGRPWNDCQGDEKAALRKRFDHIKADAQKAAAAAPSDPTNPDAPPAGLAKILDEIGVIAPR